MVQQAILVVDDEAPMRKFVSHSLKVGGYSVLIAVDGSEALKVASEQPFDLLLLDIGLPGPDGLTVLQAVRRNMQVPVLMISARGREADRVQALDLGADDYLTKPFGVAELLARVRALLRRTSPGPMGPLRAYHYQGLEVDFSARRARMHGQELPLTRREFEVVSFLAQNAGKVLLHRQVLQSVWGGNYCDEAEYIWTFVQRIRRKLEPDRHHPKYVLTLAGVGYWMPAAEPDAAS
jgi:two-component system KDP operon response regulator KdpE